MELPEPGTPAPKAAIEAGDPAYVNYTSGSTGQPKGVVVPHRGVVRLVKGTDYVSLGSDETILHLSPLSFDASTFEIWGALLNGGRVVVMKPGAPTLSEIGEAIRTHGVTTTWLTAGLFHLMVEERLNDLKPLRQLLAGGDVLSPEHVRKLHRAVPGCRIINGYGPTENTTFTCCYTVGEERDLSPSVPIGRPIANTEVYILDAARQPVPIGVAGEIYAGGDGVACGYLNRPELTAAKFVPDTFSGRAGARLYRTGDFARWRADGNIEYLGRLDHQVKIRGFRVELGEIEDALNRYPGVLASVVVAREDSPGDKRIVAYLVTRDDSVDPAQWREHLKTKLPDYMVPSAFITLESLPLTLNGKVDRRALPKPAEAESAADGNEEAAPATPTELALAEVWRDVLERDFIAVDDDFFELGGHSLLAVKLINKIRDSLSRELPIHVLFQNPTIRKLAAHLEAEDPLSDEPDSVSQEAGSSLVTFQAKGNRPPLFFHHGDWTGGGFYCGRLSQQLGDDQPFYALAPYRSGREATLTIEEMAQHHMAAIQKHTPHGPYYIGGYCVGATVATEIARLLEEKGEKVNRLILIDLPAASSPLHRQCWPLTNQAGDILGWDLQRKIHYFDLSFTAFERWLSKSTSNKITSLGRRLRLVKASPPAPATTGPEDGDLDGEILKSLDFAVYVLAYRRHKLRTLNVPTTIYFSEEEAPSRLSAEHAREIYPGVTIETVPGNHRTCIIQHTSALVDKMKVTLGDGPAVSR